ncbi:MAG: zinc ribbon domain-containing protein [Chloroflexota bacterium]|jgi:RNase P subunit RPR2
MNLFSDYNPSKQQQRTYHGRITPDDVARSLSAAFNRGNFRAQHIGSGHKISIQIATRDRAGSGGQTAITVTIEALEDGVSIHMGRQAWLGVAASIGKTAFFALRNPLHLLNRLDDLAQDIESLGLSEQIWQVIDQTARSLNSTFELSERLRRLVCDFCNTPNPVGEPHCIACGAPLGNVQPRTCRKCGYAIHFRESSCPNCGSPNPIIT